MPGGVRRATTITKETARGRSRADRGPGNRDRIRDDLVDQRARYVGCPCRDDAECGAWRTDVERDPSSASSSRSPTSSTTPSTGDNTGSSPATNGTIQVEDPPKSAQPFQTVRIQGTYRGGAGTLLRVQSWEEGSWLTFPLSTKTDQSGHFTAYVELGEPGRYQLRMVDTESGVLSEPFVLVIRS